MGRRILTPREFYRVLHRFADTFVGHGDELGPLDRAFLPRQLLGIRKVQQAAAAAAVGVGTFQ